jgi:RNA polymerase sigma-70 factor (ECF subfamily)
MMAAQALEDRSRNRSLLQTTEKLQNFSSSIDQESEVIHRATAVAEHEEMKSSMQMTPVPVEVFISYAHNDEPHQQKLEAHLSLLQRDTHFAEMVERAQSGDRDAIVSLLHEYEGPISAFIRKGVGNIEDAKDLYQEFTLRVCKGLPKTDERLRIPVAAKKWMFIIATNLIREHFEAFNKLNTVSLDDLEQQFQAGDVKAAKDWRTVEQLEVQGVEEMMCSQEDIQSRRKIVSLAFNQVPGQFRKCFYMKNVQNLSHQEIANTLGISESAARSYASRGRKLFVDAVVELRRQQEGGIE